LISTNKELVLKCAIVAQDTWNGPTDPPTQLIATPFLGASRFVCAKDGLWQRWWK